jgi:hypothetical protein
MKKVCYTITKPGMSNLACGNFTNKKILYEKLVDEANKNNAIIKFYGVLKFESKKFNYKNITDILISLGINESFGLKFELPNGSVRLYEITMQNYNQFTLI